MRFHLWQRFMFWFLWGHNQTLVFGMIFVRRQSVQPQEQTQPFLKMHAVLSTKLIFSLQLVIHSNFYIQIKYLFE